MDRKDIDAFVAHYRLPAASTAAALDIAAARPDQDELREFIVRLLQRAGVLSLGAGLVFFIAANWQAMGVAGRFALAQGCILASVALALWRPAPQPIGRYALLLAFIATGALLALYGQTYQTGADVYELFLGWALLGLAFVVAGQWSALNAAWVIVLNGALLLYYGGNPTGGWLWAVLASWQTNPSMRLLAPALINLALWALAEYGLRRRGDALGSRWVARLTLACALGFLSWAGFSALTRDSVTNIDAATLSVVLMLEAGVIARTWLRREDVFPLTLTLASLILLGAVAIGARSRLEWINMTFVLAVWIITSSTFGAWFLMSLVRTWHATETEG